MKTNVGIVQADGRIIKVSAKVGGYATGGPSAGPSTKNARGTVIDGSMGFTEGTADASSGSRSNGRPLYSDNMVGGRGRGRGGRGRGGR